MAPRRPVLFPEQAGLALVCSAAVIAGLAIVVLAVRW